MKVWMLSDLKFNSDMEWW